MAATKRKNMNPRIERKITRISGVREVKQTFLIICEGVNTEPDYFNAFRLTSATVKAIGQGMGTLALVQKAINIKEQERQRGRTYNQNWVVFDKDDFPENNFNSAILSARQNGFEVAYSNQAFEFWFLLHFNLGQVGGKKTYGYLPKPMKKLVDEIVDQMARLPTVDACYQTW